MKACKSRAKIKMVYSIDSKCYPSTFAYLPSLAGIVLRGDSEEIDFFRRALVVMHASCVDAPRD